MKGFGSNLCLKGHIRGLRLPTPNKSGKSETMILANRDSTHSTTVQESKTPQMFRGISYMEWFIKFVIYSLVTG